MTRRGGLNRALRTALGCACVAAMLVGCAGPGERAATAPNAPLEPGTGTVQRDRTFVVRDSGPLSMDLYSPTDGRMPRPLVVYVHGGGWDAGERSLAGGDGPPTSPLVRALVQRGYAVATVDYRLAGTARYPAQVADVAEAVRWLRGNAERWQIDPDRVALWGTSSGGHLAARVGAAAGGTGAAPADRRGAQQPDDTARPKRAAYQRGTPPVGGVRAVVDWFGPLDLSARTARRQRDAPLFAGGMTTDLLGCAPADCPNRAARASPTRQLSAGQPPVLVQHGIADEVVPVQQSVDFARKAEKRGVPVELHTYPELGHDFSGNAPISEITRTAVRFLDEHV